MRAVLVLVSLAAGYVAAQDFGTVAACGQTCFNNMKGKIGGCAADNQKCHCDAPDYRNGLRDCVSQSCAAPDIPLVQNSLATYVTAVCNAAAAAPPAASAPSTSATPAPAPATSSPAAPATPSAPSTSTPAPAPTTSAQTSTSTAPASAPTTSQTHTAPVAASTASTSSSHSSTGSASSSASSSSASSSPTSAGAAAGASNSKPDSLSSATVAGIAIGSSAIGIALIGVLVCVFLHKRNKRRAAAHGNDVGLSISQPMPGSGRSYAGDHHNEKYEMSSSLDDFKSRRYEDMLPRQTPRTMV